MPYHPSTDSEVKPYHTTSILLYTTDAQKDLESPVVKAELDEELLSAVNEYMPKNKESFDNDFWPYYCVYMVLNSVYLVEKMAAFNTDESFYVQMGNALDMLDDGRIDTLFEHIENRVLVPGSGDEMGVFYENLIFYGELLSGHGMPTRIHLGSDEHKTWVNLRGLCPRHAKYIATLIRETSLPEKSSYRQKLLDCYDAESFERLYNEVIPPSPAVAIRSR